MNDLFSKIEKSSWYLEPATYFMLHQVGERALYKYIPKDLKNINEALFYFEKGIFSYFNIWLNKGSLNKSIERNVEFINVERHLICSILHSVYDKEKDIDCYESMYLNGNIVDKYKVFNFLLNSLLKMPKADSKSKNPKDSYNRLLVASWSSTWLTNHYWESQRINIDKYEPLKDMMNEMVEIPLRDMGVRIRSMGGEAKYLTDYL